LLKCVAQPLLALFTFNGLLAKSCVTQVIVGSKYDGDGIIGTLLIGEPGLCRVTSIIL